MQVPHGNGVPKVTKKRMEPRSVARSQSRRTGSSLLPALVAASGGLAGTAHALELGDITVQSRLGQPLRASIAYALGPNEELASYCVSLRGAASGGMPTVSGANISIANGVISLTGRTPIREPLVTARVVINCPYTPHLSREYMMFVDPPGLNAVAETTPVVAARPEPAATPREPVVARRQATTTAQRRTPPADIRPESRYRVQPGDSLSEIAQRIEDRPVGLWTAVNAIFEANPNAFIDADPNQLKAGSWLVIPDFVGSSPTFAEAAPPAATPAETSAPAVEQTAAGAYDAFETTAPGIDLAAGEVAPSQTVESSTTTPIEQPNEATIPVDDDATGQLAAAEASEPTVVIPDTPLESPPIAESPNTPVATIVPQETATTGSTNWPMLLVTGTLALFALFLVFGRRLRDTFGSKPVGPETTIVPAAKRTIDFEEDTIEVVELPAASPEAIAAVDPDYDISDDSPTEENLALDADLVIGTGLSEGTDVELNQDFGFAASQGLDLELPEQTEDDDASETDIIAPPDRSSVESILESEVLPNDDEYDMSVIVDATKMPSPEDVTEKDLQAVVVDTGNETLVSDDYTLSRDVDYDILEQDYEDELTATQALNREIEKAAAELAKPLDETDDVGGSTSVQLASVTELDLTANLPSQNDDSGATTVNEAITAKMRTEEKTVEMPARSSDKTVEIVAGGGDATIEIVAGDGDSTVEMEVESGKVNTKSG